MSITPLNDGYKSKKSNKKQNNPPKKMDILKYVLYLQR